MTTGSVSGVARNDGSQKVHFIRRRVQFSDLNIAAGTGVKIGRLPNRAFVSAVKMHLTTVYNSTTSDTLQLGTTATGVDILAATNVHTGASTGFSNLTSAAGLGLAVTGSAEVDVFVKLAPGTASTATTGDVTFTIEYIPDNDN
jgi:hypothetical protein